MDSKGTVYILDADRAATEARARLFASVNLNPRIYQSPKEFLRSFAPDQPCCLLSPINMPELPGLMLLARLQKCSDPLPVIVITAYDDVRTAVQAIKLGAVEFLETPVDNDLLLRLVQHWVNVNAAERDNLRKCIAVREKLATLSARESEVLAGVMDGLSNKELARRLGVSPKSIEVYRRNLMTKMAARSISGLVRDVLCYPHSGCNQRGYSANRYASPCHRNTAALNGSDIRRNVE